MIQNSIFWATLFLTNSLLMIIQFFLLKNRKKIDNYKVYTAFLLFLIIHISYLLFKLLYFEDLEYGIILPLGVLYGPFFFFLIQVNSFNTIPPKACVHCVPFVILVLFSCTSFLLKPYFPEITNYYKVFLVVCTGLSFLFYALWSIMNKVNFVKQNPNMDLDMLVVKINYLMIILAFLNFGELYNDYSDISFSFDVELIYCFVILIISLYTIRKLMDLNYEKKQVDNNLKVDRTEFTSRDDVKELLDSCSKYNKSKVDDSMLDVYLNKILKIDDSFFLDSNINLDFLEKHLGINKHYLAQMFTFKLNTSFSKYVNEKRLNHARNLLLDLDSKMNIEEIAFESGFRTLRSFYRVFKDRFGVTPNQYRLQEGKTT